MASRTRDESAFQVGAVPWILLVVACGLLIWQPARAGCTNYLNYLNWMSATDVPAVPGSVDVQGDLAYITLSLNGIARLLVVDVSNERTPEILGSLDLPDAPSEVAVSGDIAAISLQAIDGDGLVVVDISDSGNPEIVGSTLADHECWSVQISGDHAYVASRMPAAAFFVVDLTDPAAPDSVTSIDLPGEPRNIVIEGDYAYLPTGVPNLLTFDISTPASPAIVDVWNFTNRYPVEIDVYGAELFVSVTQPASNAEVPRFRIGDTPWDPQYHNACAAHGADDNPLLAVGNGVLYVGSDTNPVRMIDVTTESCQAMDVLPYPGGSLSGLTIHGHALYYFTRDTVDDDGRFHIISVSSPDPLTPISQVETPGTAEDIVIAPDRAGLAYVADGNAGLQVVDITDPLNPVIIGNTLTPGYAVGVALLGSTVFVADSGAGVQAVNVSVADDPTIIDAVDTPGSAVDIALTATHAYVADSSHGVRVIDIGTPSNMFEVGMQDTLTASTGIDVSGAYAYVADGDRGMVILQASDPSNPWIIDGIKGRAPDAASKIDYALGRAYVTDPDEGLFIIDVTDPYSPADLGSIGTIGEAGDVDRMGIFAYVGSGEGMQLIDIADPVNPMAIGNVVVPAEARGLFIDRYYAYIAAADSGLYVCPAQCGFDESVIAYFTPDVPADFVPHTVTFVNESEGYGLSYAWDFGDDVGTSTETSPSYAYDLPADYTVTLIATNGTNSDTTSTVVSALSEAPVIRSIVDVPEDQGGYVYVNFYFSGYDDDVLNRSEMYTVQRQDAGQWVNLTSFGAYGEHDYAALAATPGDGEAWTTPFRVIAHMDEGNWASAPMTGYSEDNIAPEAPANVAWLGERHLGWDPVAATDFAYFRVYGCQRPSLDGAVSLATTVDTDVELADIAHPWVLVVAVDDYGLESEPSLPVGVTDVPGVITTVQLSRAVPNPFNPSTTIAYALPADGPVRLSVYDVSGRLVRVLVNGEIEAGRHAVVWRGRNSDGRLVASGTYFSRLEAAGRVLTGRMTLLK